MPWLSIALQQCSHSCDVCFKKLNHCSNEAGCLSLWRNVKLLDNIGTSQQISVTDFELFQGSSAFLRAYQLPATTGATCGLFISRLMLRHSESYRFTLQASACKLFATCAKPGLARLTYTNYPRHEYQGVSAWIDELCAWSLLGAVLSRCISLCDMYHSCIGVFCPSLK